MALGTEESRERKGVNLVKAGALEEGVPIKGNMHMRHLRILFKCRFWFWKPGEPEILFLTSSQVMPMLLVQGSHLEWQSSQNLKEAGMKWKEWTYLSLLSAHLSKVAHCLNVTKRQRQRRLGDLALEDVNNKLVLAQGICHLSLWWLNPVQLQLLTFDTFWRKFRMHNKNEALGPPRKLVEQVLS